MRKGQYSPPTSNLSTTNLHIYLPPPLHQALQDDITTLRTNMENIASTGTQMVEEAKVQEPPGGVEFAGGLERRMAALTHRWETVTHMATLQNRSLKEALTRSQKVWGEGRGGRGD